MTAIDFAARGLARQIGTDLAANEPGKGASLIGVTGGDTLQDRLRGYSTRAGIAALTPSSTDRAFLTEGHRTGTFIFDASDLSAKVAADTLEGIYIAPDSDPTGASGAWVRQYVGQMRQEWFGAGKGSSAPQAAATTAALQSFIDFDVDNTKRELILPAGQNWSEQLTTPAGSWHSFALRGDAFIYGSRLTLNSAAENLLTFGDGEFNMFHVVLEDFALNGDDIVTSEVVLFDRGNFLYLKNLHITGFEDAVGIKMRGGATTAASNSLMGEAALYNVNLFARQGGGSGHGLVGLDLINSGNIDCYCVNSETSKIAFRAYGEDAIGIHNMFGGHVERTLVFAFERQDQSGFVRTSVSEGAVWLGNGCVGNDMLLMQSGAGNYDSISSGVCDNGFGNRVARVGAAITDSAAKALSFATQGHYQDGLEWCRVPGLNPNPMFEGGDDYAVTSNCTLYEVPSPLPNHAPGAGALRLVATANGGYIEFGPFYADTAKDYLGLVGLLINRHSHDEVTIGLYDSANTLLESKTIRPMSANVDNTTLCQFRFEKVLATAIAGTTIKLRITLATSGSFVECWFADIKQSENLHLTKVSNSDSTSGSGATKKYRKQLTGSAMSVVGLAAVPMGCGNIEHLMMDIVSESTGKGYLSEGGTPNTPTLRHRFRLPYETGEREWTWYTPHAAKGVGNTKLALSSFNTPADTVDIWESSVHLVFPDVRITRHEAGFSGSALNSSLRIPLWLPAKGQRGLILGARYAFEMITTNTGTGSNYWRLDLKKRTGTASATTLWSINNQSANFATGAPTDILRSVFEAVATPLLLNDNDKLYLELAKVNSAVDFDGSVKVTLLMRDFLPTGA